MKSVPEIRRRDANSAPVNAHGDYVLYWMIAQRRTAWNFSLDRAIEWAKELNKPLVIFEALRCDYPWASDRLHRFILDGMAVQQTTLQQAPVLYFPYVEPKRGAGKGLLQALAANACVVITDDFPGFFLPSMVKAAAQKLSVKLETVDSNGLLPLRAADEVYPTAYAFRRFLQKNLAPYLEQRPQSDPWRGLQIPRLQNLPETVLKTWPLRQIDRVELQDLPIDHQVQVVDDTRGGALEAQERLKVFLQRKLQDYQEHRSEPDSHAASGLSPYLHFGHLSVHQVFHELAQREQWTPEKLSARASGSKEGWWGMGKSAEAFLDEIITWREVGYNMTSKRENYDRFESLPEWAQRTLAKHEKDPRPHRYDLSAFEAALTHDELWNAAQRQLVREGVIQNYLRMLWGKKILEWSASPREALEIMIELNNKYALDGRNPNSYSGIFWCLGRYDRPWGPERAIFGLIRYMSSDNTARKFNVKNYLKRYAR